MTATPPWGNTPDPGAYGRIKIAEILHAMSIDEVEEYRRIMRTSPRTDEMQARAEELWKRASELNRRAS